MKYLLAITALLYSQIAIPEQTWEGWQPWQFGAPCTLAIDFEDEQCVKVEVREIDWSGRK